MKTQDDVRQFILEKSKEGAGKGKLSQWSMSIGRNPTFLQQFIVRRSPQKLDEDDRQKLADVMGVPEDDLRASGSVKGNGAQIEGFVPKVVPLIIGEAEMPLYRFAHGGQPFPILEQIPFESARRPESLMKTREPYGVMVEGDSMAPEYRSGWIAQVNPNLTPHNGDTCIFRGEQADGTHVAVIKRLKKQTPTHWHVEQYNPKRSFTLKKSLYQVAHVTVGSDRRRS